MNQAAFTLRGRNPDVLSCIANLSNDEVFTPPEFANRMLDTLAEAWAADNDGANIWADPSVRFLDPCTKSGVFLREITKRLIDGLEPQMPDLQTRVDHILTRQVYGIGITELTAMLARRSLYCSKHANGPHSISRGFNAETGNVWFERVEHTWEKPDEEKKGKCIFCGAGSSTLDRGDDRESHAYAFIHTDNIQERVSALFGDDMQFDVIIGNPPYQLEDGGGSGSSARPIYQHFVAQAKQLQPRYLSMVIPSRWFTGGKGLDEFRQTMLSDERISSVDDYIFASDVFPGVALKGGVCYFLWDSEASGTCEVNTHFSNEYKSQSSRPLLEQGTEVFVRFNEGLSVLKKVVRSLRGDSDLLQIPKDVRFSDLVSARRPFGIDSKFQGRKSMKEGDLTMYRAGGVGYIQNDQVTSGRNLIDCWKIFVGFAAPGTGNKDTYPHKIISTPFLGKPYEISSETFLCIGPFANAEEASSGLSYLSCKFTRFLIQLHKPSHNTTRRVYTFVPKQSWDRQWTDEALYEKYNLTDEEIDFIDKIVRPMDLDLFDNLAED